MKILAIETAFPICSITLKVGEQHFSQNQPALHEQSQVILPVIDKILSTAKLSLNELDCLALSVGPGSFTGIRLGMSVAQGLAFPFELPVMPVDSLQALAQAFYEKNAYRQIAVCTNAYMQQVFFGAFHFDEQGQIQVCHPSGLFDLEALPELPAGEWAAIGNGWAVYPEETGSILQGKGWLADPTFLPPSAKAVADLGERLYHTGQAQTLFTLQPSYLRTAKAWKTSS